MPPALWFWLLLHDVDGETAVLPIQVDVFDAAVLKVGGGIHVEGEAFLLQLLHRGRQIGRAHGDVAVLAQEGRFHALEVGAAEFGFLAVAGLQIEHRAQQLGEVGGFLGVGRVDTDVL